MFQKFISKHNAPINSTRFVATKTPAATAPTLAVPDLSRSTIQINATTTAVTTHSGLCHVVRIDETNPTNHHALSVAGSLSNVPADMIAFAIRFEVADGVVPNAVPALYDVYPIETFNNGKAISFKDAVTIDSHPRTVGNDVYAGIMLWSNAWTASTISGVLSVNQVNREATVLQPLK